MTACGILGKLSKVGSGAMKLFNNGAINKKRALIAKLEVAGCPFSALQCEIWEKRGLKVYKRASTYKREQYKLTIHNYILIQRFYDMKGPDVLR